PIGLEGGINPYVFGGNDPVNFSDPTGLESCIVIKGGQAEAMVWEDGKWVIRATRDYIFCFGGPGGATWLAPIPFHEPRSGPPTEQGLEPVRWEQLLPSGKGAAGAAILVGSIKKLGSRLAKANVVRMAAKLPGETSNLRHAFKKLGLSQRSGGRMIEELKDAAGLRGNDDVWIDTTTGAVRSMANGEIIGHLKP
ncbi:MAG: RHS repeat domain-containing protein, partial [Gemmatimonadota bacterium]